jgi:hypothetical protein
MSDLSRNEWERHLRRKIMLGGRVLKGTVGSLYLKIEINIAST